MNTNEAKAATSGADALPKAVVQIIDGELLAMLPDGVVVLCDSPADARRKIDRWSRREMRSTGAAIVLTEIVWDGVQPPTDDQVKWQTGKKLPPGIARGAVEIPVESSSDSAGEKR